MVAVDWGQRLRRLAAACAAAGLGASVAKLFLLGLRARRMKRMLADVPQGRYKTSPLLGGIPELVRNRKRLHDFRIEMVAGLPISKLTGICLDPDGFVLTLMDPALIKHMLKDNFENYTKASRQREPLWYYFGEWLGNGIFILAHGPLAPDKGQNWAKQRKIAAGIFSRGNFNNNMHAVFADKAARLRELLVKPAEAGERVDLQRHFFGFTMDSIMQIFFGEEADTMSGQANTYADAFDCAHRCFMEYTIGSMAYLKLTQLLPWPVGGAGGAAWKLHGAASPVYRDFARACRTLDRESKRLVEACRADPHLAKRKDLLALFVAAEEKEHFSTEFLRDVVLNFVIAGRDTTACALSWMFFVLATHPDIQERLCREVDEKLPGKSVPTLKSLAASEMPYLQGVFYETLRLHPPVPWDTKVASADDILPDGTRVPANTELVFMPYAMGRDAERYPEPEVVKPERWIPFSAPPPHEFPVFQAGPRICLGMDMAIFEAKLAACTLLQEYTFELAPGELEKITYSPTLTMAICNSKEQDSHNLWLIPKKRAEPKGHGERSCSSTSPTTCPADTP